MFEDIRPYNDAETQNVLQKILKDRKFAKSIGSLLTPRLNEKAPWLVQPLVIGIIKSYLGRVKTIDSLQMKIKPLVHVLLKKSISELSVHGLEHLDTSKSYLFISNHRDIIMDPCIICWALVQNGFRTPRLAIGDNLLTLPFSSNLMRLNKSFIVKRNLETRREKLNAAKQLSSYIQFSLSEDKSSVWIAQREGRAKDGYDLTNPALISMLSLSRSGQISYSDYINSLNIVPVAISYELDPLDLVKARELYTYKFKGKRSKRHNEDLISIARGITGWKGRVHVEFGKPIGGDFQTEKEVASTIDKHLHYNYRTFGTNAWAEAALDGSSLPTSHDKSIELLRKRVHFARDEIKPYILKQYANSMRMRRGEPPF
ncbi:1-acyl-sn-glycerol-3-phosphate acyltransferase [Cellvibrio sp. QJXJ]|uniref:1-acyl-sn-glycerol-3-phosphate acyltransferase n=1 Tax=Cellvibrio sp. QJXJ TaxID=2964606 RepID=UPI0021C441C7|nr:1-acyl-sn-glycerol-3-phosphate acyltransferase [Cellvibrio sp. QJXJ]UUA73400.1 1-acyl-sn-glycerol-3-phosphate acyltransferase [Cellvibrio sp. QJXJ]